MTNEELATLKEYAEKWAEAKKNEAKTAPCPSCGHCPTCGRRWHHLAPWAIPMPNYYQPYYQPYQVWCGTETRLNA
jgi:hypothetical protein